MRTETLFYRIKNSDYKLVSKVLSQFKQKLARLENLIAITTDNDIYSIDRYLVSTRRPFPVVEDAKPKKKKKKNEPEEEEVTYISSFLPQFEYMIPFNPKQV